MNLSSSEQAEYSWIKVLLWAFLFYLAWNREAMVLVMSEGVLPGPDDFLRLSQVESWLADKSWYDLRADRIFPPVGADIHWSRLADAPIGLLISFFNNFTDITTSGRIVGVIWPLSLFLLTLSAMVALCDRLVGKQQRLLVVFFFVMLMSTLAEFRPGRFDHHNIQILLLISIMLGIVSGLGRFSNYFVGFFAVLSVVIGLDLILLIISILAFISLEWCFQRERSAKRLLEVGAAMSFSTLVLYMVSFPPQRWFSNNACDAFSMFYLIALVLLSVVLIFLSISSNTKFLSSGKIAFKRVSVGAALGTCIIILLFILFPHCLEGPLGNVNAELKTRWLDVITEAKGLIEFFSAEPSNWIGQGIYLVIMLFVMAMVFIKKKSSKPELMIIGFILVICILGAFYQARVLRTGIYAAIPFCVLFTMMTKNWLVQKFKTNSPIIYLAQGAICVVLTSAFWFVLGALSVIKPDNTVANVQENIELQEEVIKPAKCTSDIAQKPLNSLKTGLVISGLNTATSILVHSLHSIEAGSYHRNGESILNVINFFGSPPKVSKQIADQRKIDYVVICKANIFSYEDRDRQSLALAIENNQIPQWLEWVSKPDEPLAILKVVR